MSFAARQHMGDLQGYLLDATEMQVKVFHWQIYRGIDETGSPADFRQAGLHDVLFLVSDQIFRISQVALQQGSMLIS